jgi:hypothetical protein
VSRLLYYRSKRAGDFVVVLDQADEREAARDLPEVPRYSEAELHHIGTKALADPSPEMRTALLVLALVKRVFPGSVILGDLTDERRALLRRPRFGPIRTNEEVEAYEAERVAGFSSKKTAAAVVAGEIGVAS